MRIPPIHWLFLVPFYSFLFKIDVLLVSGYCLEDQRSLLLQFKNNLTFDITMSRKIVGWDQNSDCCDWKGVNCNNEGLVTSVDLSEESISGGFEGFSSLFNLQHLQRLNLGFNNFNSVIPSGFQKLKNLSYLNLSNAGLQGQIPIGISHLTRLVVLDMSTNSYLGDSKLKLENPNLEMLVRKLNEVRELYLDGVNISAKGYEWCNALASSLPKLRVLSLSGCNMIGPIDSSLAKLETLSIIHLGNNNLSAEVPEFFGNFSNLTILHLSSCGLKGFFPQNIFKARTLEVLDVSENEALSGSLPEFPQNASLKSLVLRNTNFSGVLPNSLGNLKHLSMLELSGCWFNGTLPKSMSELTQLVYLDLSSNKFTGPIPSFAMSKNLTRVALSHNKLTGPVPAHNWEGLSNLVEIDFRNNSLNGSIPSSLFVLPSLEKIQLSFNQFKGGVDEFPSPSSSSLDTLDLSCNQLEGPIPSSVFKLRGLNMLQLSSNKFNGTLQLDAVWVLENLATLDLSHNNLSINASVSKSHLSSFPNMSTLKLASCNLKEFPDILRNQSRLNFLDLSNNQIKGSIPNWIWELGYLGHLNLSHNLLQDMGGSVNDRPPNLFVLDLHSNHLQGRIPILHQGITFLDLSRNSFSSIIPYDIGNYISFTVFFSLSRNKFHGGIPESICNTSSLQVLDLSYNNLSGSIPQCLIRLSETLGVLNLRGNNLRGNISDTFSDACALRTIDLNSNHIGGQLPLSLVNCTNLEVFDIGNNQIVDRYPCLLKNISTLRILVLRSNHFHGPIGCPGTEGNWKMLQIVDLAQNQFNGSLLGKCLMAWEAMMLDDEEDEVEIKLNHLQFEVLQYSDVYYQDVVTVSSKGMQLEFTKVLTFFTAIDLSSNYFEGPIPKEMMDLKALYVLNLSHNAFSGQIPSSIGNLRQLESLDLSVNKLKGEIPSSLANLSFLSFLNLSFNDFVGEIPKSTQIQTFEPRSFLGNERLCGALLGLNCSITSSPPSVPSQVPYKVSRSTFNWKFVSTGVGFGLGAGLVVAPIMLWERGRRWTDNSIDRILLVILPMLGLVYTPSNDDDDSEADKDKETTGTFLDITDNSDIGENKFGDARCHRRFCVFCSKLDITWTKVVHDPKCTCFPSPPISSSSSSSSSSFI